MRKYQEMSPKILVIGDLMIDCYLWGVSSRVSPEAPVPVVDIQRETKVLGGAGNVINNLIALGADVTVASVLGDDEIGRELIEKLKSIGVKTHAIVFQEGRKSTQKSRVIASNQQVVRFDSETKEEIDVKAEKMLIEMVVQKILSVDIVLISDYAKGVLTDSFLKKVIEISKSASKKVLIDPKGREYLKYRGATLITPNRKEATEASGIDIIDESTLKEAGFWLKEHLNLESVIITLSEDGIAIFGEDMVKIPTVAREVYDVTGAGDTVLATLGFVLACEGDIEEACRVANASAAVVVGKLGSATASWDEIIGYETTLHESTTEHRVVDRVSIVKKAHKFREKGKKIIFTNGCFDILHIGHIKYLERAKSFGDVLIVGLNSDESVKRLKGESRPINPEFDRAYLLSALHCVDYVVIFEEDTPYNLIKSIRPNLIVKGGDYRGKEVVGAEIAEEVRLVDFISGKSTTSIIEKVRNRL